MLLMLMQTEPAAFLSMFSARIESRIESKYGRGPLDIGAYPVRQWLRMLSVQLMA